MRHYGLILDVLQYISLVTAYTFALILLFVVYNLLFCCIDRAISSRDELDQFDKVLFAPYDVVGEPVRLDQSLKFTLRFGLLSVGCLYFDVIGSGVPVQGQICPTASDPNHVVSGAGDSVLGVVVVRAKQIALVPKVTTEPRDH